MLRVGFGGGGGGKAVDLAGWIVSVFRTISISILQEKNLHTVCQFQYTDWPDTGLPDSGVGIVDLIGQVQKWQQQSGNTAIVIHCR